MSSWWLQGFRWLQKAWIIIREALGGPVKRVIWGRGWPLLLLWDECPSCEGMTKCPDPFGCWDCRNGGRLPHWAPPGPWLLFHLRRFWVDVVEGLKSFYRLLD